MKKIISINPANNEVIGETPITTKEELQRVVAKATAAFPAWKALPIQARTEYVKKLIPLIEKNTEKIATLITNEMGKTLQESREEVESELKFIRWYTEHAEEALGEKIIREDEKTLYKSVYEPWGVCASIAPWNFPLGMASTGITAQLLAGNTVIFKPSEYTTLSQKLFVDIFNETGLPDGVLQYVVGEGDVGAALVDSDIDLVWFTGSTKVGQEIYKKCAEKFIKPLLELGGSSPAIVFADCYFNKTIETVYDGRFYNCGQTCNAIKRLFVEKSIFDRFVASLSTRVQKAELGPIVSKKQLDMLISQVEDAKKAGAVVVTGGKRPEGKEHTKGNYYLPTLLINITPKMRVFREEVFGPVLSIIPFDDEKQAIRMANHTPYGLTAEIFTQDAQKANRVAAELLAGGISINMDFAYVPDCPTGGYKKSGLGREYGLEGFKELAQLKYICVAK